MPEKTCVYIKIQNMNILIAPNAFKNSLDANNVANAIEEGLKQSGLDCTTSRFPIGDGGDGTGSLLIEACKGSVKWKEVSGPLGRKVKASFGLIDNGKTAVIEMADASGLRLLTKEELNPLTASSFGTGELIKFALDEGVDKIIIAMGGSATVDGGCGILNALGVNFLDASGNSLNASPSGLANLAMVENSQLDARLLNCEIIILCDVDNKLLGLNGAAAVFGPQKGATSGDVFLLDKFLSNFAQITLGQTGIDMAEIKHSGTAGGAAAGLHAWVNAKLVNGIENFLAITKFDDALKISDLVITGEGSIDSQTLQGKGPFGVASQAKFHNIPVIGIAGKVPLDPDEDLQKYFDVLISINNEATDIETAMKNTRDNLVRTAKMIGDLIKMRND
jgi:glycerate 2-kinase